MKCYLHIGGPKTATSSIQKFLQINKDLLYELGYYLNFFDQQHNFALSTYCYDSYFEHPHFNVLKIKSQNHFDIFKKKYFKTLQETYAKEIDKKVIISSENIQGLSRGLVHVKNLKQLLINLGFDEYKVIYYIRAQEDFASSLIAQNVRDGDILTEGNILERVGDYRKKIGVFEEVFGRDNIDVRIFDQNEFKNASIIDDFLDAIDLDFNISEFILPEKENESLSDFGVNILSEINKLEAPFVNKSVNVKREGIKKVISNNFKDSKYRVSKKNYILIQEHFRDSNEWIRKEYFPKRNTLFNHKEYKDSAIVNISNKQVNKIAKSIVELTNSKVNYVFTSGFISSLLLFIDSLDKNKKYVVYGYGSIGKLFVRIYENKANLIIVDKDFCKAKDIKSPNQLNYLKYDKVIVTVLGREEEIIEELSKKYDIAQNNFLTINV